MTSSFTKKTKKGKKHKAMILTDAKVFGAHHEAPTEGSRQREGGLLSGALFEDLPAVHQAGGQVLNIAWVHQHRTREKHSVVAESRLNMYL